METELTARIFAVAAHGPQLYGKAPYVVHLDDVHALVVEHGGSPEERIAAYLHDVPEDTTVTREAIEAKFGAEVSGLVAAVTKLTGEPMRAYYGKIRAHGPRATRIKLCDRLANVREARAWGREKYLEKYKRERALFEEVLRVPGEHEELWAKLAAAFGE